MKPKHYAIAILTIIVVGYIVFLQLDNAKLRGQVVVDNTAIEEANYRTVEAENKVELLEQGVEIYRTAWQLSVDRYNDKFDSINFQDPDITDIPQVDSLIIFLPDSVYFDPEFIEETRIAITNYKWIDADNKYAVDFKIRYDYKHLSFEITPENLSYKPPKKYNLTTSVLIASNGYGFMIDYQIWRFEVGVGGIVTKDIEGIALIKIGFRL